MRQENFDDAAVILQNIINQPLAIPGASKDVSLLSAAKSFNPNDAENSDLNKILMVFQQYPDPTKTLITELEIIIRDLEM